MLCFLKISFPSRSFEEAMCIMFVYIDNSPPEEGYRLVVTNNRDERFNKPTKPADFWQDDRTVLVVNTNLLKSVAI